jgi:hypothetical protein
VAAEGGGEERAASCWWLRVVVEGTSSESSESSECGSRVGGRLGLSAAVADWVIGLLFLA